MSIESIRALPCKEGPQDRSPSRNLQIKGRYDQAGASSASSIV
jgi:hypothetical protein